MVANAGNANAATGAPGERDAEATAAKTAQLLGLAEEEVLVLSTGVIGVPLPLEPLLAGLDGAAAALSADGGADAAEAILTTDTRTKQAVVQGPGFTVGGMAKGSGMIHPNLATMLAVVTTDYALEPGEALEFLRPAVERSFNAISVDGECSTNDAVLLLANGAAGAPLDDDAFASALDDGLLRPRRARSSPTARVRPSSRRSASRAPRRPTRRRRSRVGSRPRRS